MKILSISALFLLAVYLIFGTVSMGYAFSIEIKPGKINLESAPGANLVGMIEVSNKGDKIQGFSSYTEDFIVNKEGNKEVRPAGSTPRSCASWIKILPSVFDVNANNSTKVKYTITVPRDAAGDYYALIFFETENSESGLKGRIGASLYLNIKERVGFRGTIPELSASIPEESLKTPPKEAELIKSKEDISDEDCPIKITNLEISRAGYLPELNIEFYYNVSKREIERFTLNINYIKGNEIKSIEEILFSDYLCEISGNSYKYSSKLFGDEAELYESVKNYSIEKIYFNDGFWLSRNKKIEINKINLSSRNCPLKICGYSISFNSIGIPEVNVEFYNNDLREVAAFSILIYCFNKYGEPTSDIGTSNIFSGISQDIAIKPKQSTGNQCSWVLNTFSNTRKVKIKIYKVMFENGGIWVDK